MCPRRQSTLAKRKKSGLNSTIATAASSGKLSMSTATVECPVCGREFDSKVSLGSHKAAGHDDPWMDESTLREEYVENGRSSYDLADKWGCDSKTVRNWLERHGIERREAKDYNRVEYVNHTFTPQGYERWEHHYGKDRGAMIMVHRLIAVAEYGVDAVKNNHVHHKNGVKWDNRPENLEVKDPSDHAKEHYENGDLELEPGGMKELKNEL